MSRFGTYCGRHFEQRAYAHPRFVVISRWKAIFFFTKMQPLYQVPNPGILKAKNNRLQGFRTDGIDFHFNRFANEGTGLGSEREKHVLSKLLHLVFQGELNAGQRTGRALAAFLRSSLLPNDTTSFGVR
jgi:hypothetical protein